MKTAVLFSGGLDSQWLRQFNPGSELVYFNLHTAYTKWELDGLPLDVRVIHVDCDIEEAGFSKDVRNRNLYFVARLALEYDAIVIGSTVADKKFDNSIPFLGGLAGLMKDCELYYPLKDKTKQSIYNELLVALKRPPEYRTCYVPLDNQPCGDCAACLLDGSIIKATLHGFDDGDMPTIESINVEALTADGVYDPTIVDTFAHDDWITLRNDGREIIGYVGVLDGEMTDLRVKPSFQGNGFGKLLSLYCILHFGGRFAKTMNAKSVSAWQSLGHTSKKDAVGPWYRVTFDVDELRRVWRVAG